MVGRGKTDEAPKFTGPIKSVIVDEGQSATFQAIVSGKPSPDIKWYKNEEEVVNSRDYDISYKHGRAILKIPKVKEKHVGTYKCEASNDSGKAECTAQLQTKGSNQSPQFTKKLESQVTSEGQSVRFEVIVSGVPPPTVTWSHNGDVLENSVDIQIKSEGNKHSLFIPEVFDDDAGKYQVKAESTTGMATCEATLVVNPAAPGDQGPPPQEPVTETPQAEEKAPPPPPQEEIQKAEEAVTESTPVAPPQTPPTFVKTLSDVKAAEGGPVKLECVVKGEPEPTVQWLREDLPIDPSPDFDMVFKSGRATLDIHEIYLDDAGKFSCTAVNPAGTITTSCQLTVEAKPAPKPAAPPPPPPPKQEEKPKTKTPIAPPEFVKHLEPGRFSEGQPAHFFCQVSGEPKPEVTWYRNGQEIQTGYRFLTKYDKASGRAQLEITMLLEEDQGTYTATAKSKAGQISSSAPLLPEAVYDKYMREKREEEEIAEAKAKRSNINAQLAEAFKEEKLVPSQRGTPGDVFEDDDEGPKMSPFEKRLLKEAAAREAQVESKRPRISQSDERKPSPFEQRLSNEITQRGGVDTVDSGAREPFDLAAFEAHLLQEPDKGTTAVPEETEFESEMETDSEKVSAPRFVKEMKNYRVQEGANLNLGCRVEGLPKPTLQWFKDGQPLYRSTRHELRYVEGHCSLHIELVLPEDEGYYTVLATSPAGRGVSTGRVVVDKAGSTSEIPQHMKGVMAARVHMESEAYSVPKREKYSGDVTEKHYKPKFKEVPSNVAVKEGKLTRFDCRVSGRPPPDLTWYRNGQQVYNDANHNMLTNEGGYQSLLIPYTAPADAGVYECIARNRAGEASFTVRLDVEAKADMVAPSFIDRIENVSVNEGEPICFSCKVNGLPMPQVNWQKDGSHIRPGHPSFRSEQDEHGNCQLLVERASKRDAGWITCTAFNKAGRVACRAKLTVKSARDAIYPRAPAAPPRRVPRPQPVEEPDPVPSYVQPETYSDDEFYVKPAVEPPEFIIPLNDMTDKKEGDSAHFACRLKNAKDASTRVDWYKNGQPLFVGSRVKTSNEFGICTLDIRGLYPEDSGTITCRARNASGVAETSGRLVCQGKASLILESQLPAEMRGIEKTLEQEEAFSRGDFVDQGNAFPEPEAEPPIFVKVPEPVCCREGEPARFSCRVTGHPQPRILWYKGDTLLVTTSRMKVSYDGIHTLDIPKTRPYDAGVIKMVAHNNVGKAIFETSLEVLPRGDPGPHLKPIRTEPKDLRRLRKEPVGKELQHAFTERKTHATKLTTTLKPQPKEKPQKPVPPKPVQNSPVFVYSPPSHTAAGIGDPLKLTAQISGNPSPKVTWSKDGHPLDPDNRIKMLQDNDNFTLLIVEALPEDAGSYQIDAVNPSGSASQTFAIAVRGGTSLPRQPAPKPDMPKAGSPPIFEHGLTDIEVPEGCPVELACQVVGDPEPEIIWYCNGAIIKPSRYFQMGYQDSIASLIINEVFPEDEGTYTCEAVNDLGSNVSHSHLKVQVEEIRSAAEQAIAPKFVKKISNMEVPEGSQARFECKVLGSPRPEVKWYKDNKEIQSNQYTSITTTPDGGSILHFQKVFADDTGRVTVVASNTAGTKDMSADLVVQGVEGPQRPLEEQPQQPEEITTIQIVQEEVSPSETTQIQFSVEDQPEYPEISIKFQPPEFVQPIMDKEVEEGDVVTLRATVKGTPPVTIHWFHEGVEVVPSPEVVITYDETVSELTVTELHPEFTGEYVCQAVNPVGSAVCTAQVVIKDHPPSPTEKADEEKPVPELFRPEEGQFKPEEIVPELTPKERKLAEELGELPTADTIQIIPPTFLQVLEPQVVRDGEPVKFTAKVVGKPTPKVTWMIDDNEIKDEPEYIIEVDETEGITTLTLPEVFPEDQATYTVKAENIAGEATSSATLLVEEDELSSEIDTEVEVMVPKKGSPLEVTVEVPEDKPQEVKPEEIKPEEVKPEEIPVEETPVEEAPVEEAPVEEAPVEEAPVEEAPIEEAPKAVEEEQKPVTADEVDVGKTPAVFVAVGNYMAEAEEVMSVREGEQLEVLDDSNDEWWLARKVDTKEEGWVPKAYLAPKEEYADRLKDQLEENIESLPVLEMLDEDTEELQAPVFTKPLQKSVTAKEHHPVVLECCVEGIPQPTIAWFRQSTPIPTETPEFVMTYENDVVRLTIKTLYPEDSGQYTCVAKNQAGTDSTQTELLVEVALSDAESVDSSPSSRKTLSRESTIDEEGIKPKFMSVSRNMIVKEGQEKVTFEFRLIASPRPQITWYKDDVPLEETPRRRLSMVADVHLYSLTLDVEDVTSDDQGVYRIEAVNREGKAVANVKLDVTPPAKIVGGPEELTVKRGESVTIDFEIAGYPEPEVVWVREIEKEEIVVTERINIIRSATRTSLLIHEAYPEDTGEYVVSVDNQIGKDEKKLKVIVLDVPEAPSKPSPTEVTPKAISLTWDAPTTDGGAPITSYVVEVFEKDTETWKQIATTVETTTTYEVPEELPEQPVIFRVVAENVVGISPPSQEIVVTIQTGAPEETKPEEVKPEEFPTKKEGMIGFESTLEWDLATILAFFIASCYVVCFWLI